jgi:hypothetical protein
MHRTMMLCKPSNQVYSMTQEVQLTMIKRFGACYFAMALLSAAFAQEAVSSFVYKFQPDQNETYKVLMDINGNLPMPGGGGGVAGQIKMSTGMFLKVSKVNDDKSASITAGLSEFSLEFNGQPFPVSLEMIKGYISDVSATLNPRGEQSNVKGGGQLPMGIRLPGFDPRNLVLLLIPTQLPDKPLTKDMTWSFTQKVGEGKDETILPIKARFEGIEEVDGVKVLKISQEFTQPIELYLDAFMQPVSDKAQAARLIKGEIKGNGTVWLNIEKGVLYKSQVAAQLNQTSEPIKKEGEEPKEYERETTSVSANINVTHSSAVKTIDGNDKKSQ